MIRRSPAELYIKYLVAHPDRYETKAIRDIVVSHQLDYPSDLYVDTLRVRMRTPMPFYPMNRLHKASFLFLCRHRLLGFFHPDDACLAAHELLKKPQAKETIETMTLSGTPAALISSRLNNIGISTKTLVVERYLQFYWDTELVDSTELRALFRMRIDRLALLDANGSISPDQSLQSRALQKVRYQDPRHMIMEMPVAPMAGLMNQLRMGLLPNRVELAKLIKATQVASTARAFFEMLAGGPNAAVRGRDYALVSKAMSEMLEEMGSPDAELQRELQQLKLQTDVAHVPRLSELGGEFTVEMETGKREVIDVKPE